MVENRADVIRIINDNFDTLHSLGVRRCGLFGSFQRDEATIESDIDLLVEFEPDQKTFLNFVNLSFFLEDLLGRKVELVTRESLSPYAGPEILSEVEYVGAPG
ncbi:MAG: nucleotidyltransferase family protein [Anaerolineales bacterium]|nr:nucleotidyltransferase family protein [Anaerolineales bacterium]MCB8958906.1 nucleotidyltransferase family protein [Ardenticatenales bacterium]